MTILQMALAVHQRKHRGRGLIVLVMEWRRRARQRQQLMTMDDLSLRDIGLTRYDAYYEARKPFWRA